MIAQIQMRRGTTAEWAAASPVVLAAGEPGWDSTLEGMKVGDDSTEWAALPWIDAKNSLADTLLTIYPIGAVYQSTVSTSPASLFGGTWAAIDAGRFLVAAGTGYDARSTGGAATVALTEAQGPVHSHTKILHNGGGALGLNTANGGTGSAGYGYVNGSTGTMSTNSAGSGDAHENRPPYYAVYMWRRTA